LKMSVDDSCNRLKYGNCTVGWGSVGGVGSSCATGVASVEVGVERLMGINVEE